MMELFSDRALLGLVAMTVLLLGLVVFFCAFTFVLRIKNEREAKLWASLKKEWEPALLDVLADSAKLPDLWEKVGGKYHFHFLEFVLRFAQRVGGTERDTLRAVAEPYLPEILPRLKHRSLGIRARAVQMLGTLGFPAFSTEVKDAINDPSPFVAAIAARLLAHDFGAEMAPELCKSLERFQTFRIWYLVDLMVTMGPGAIPHIREILRDGESHTRTRAVAAHSLSALRDLEAADLAADLALSEEDPELLTSLMALLAQVGTAIHSPAARARLDSGEFFVRAAATRTLSELGTEEDLPLLVEKLSDPSPWVKMAAARGVYRLGGRGALKALTGPEDPATPLFEQVLAEEGGR